MAKPMSVDEQGFETEVMQPATSALVDFWSQNCIHCRHFDPQFEQAAEAEAAVKFVKVSVQDARPLFQRFGITGTPTVVLFRDGVEVARQSGALSAEALVTWLHSNAGA